MDIPGFFGALGFSENAPTARADASATFGAAFNPKFAGGALTGYAGHLSLEGMARADPPAPASAKSKAMTSINFEGKTIGANGAAKWIPQGAVLIAGDCDLARPKCGKASIVAGNPNLKVKDPILFEATSLVDGSHVSETLFSFDAEITDGLGFLTFAEDGFTFYSEPGDGLTGHLIMDASSSILENPGRFELAFADGIVTTALFTGAFSADGLPHIGSALSGTYGLAMPEFHWDAGLNGETMFKLSVPLSGEAEVAVVPEPAAWVLMIAGFGFTGAVLRRRREFAKA
jgi:hypothetical protein